MKKTSDFSKFMLCPHGQVGERVEPMRTRGDGGQFFAILCGRPLWSGPKITVSHCKITGLLFSKKIRFLPSKYLKPPSRQRQGGLGVESPALGDFGGFTTKIIHFRHVSDEILP